MYSYARLHRRPTVVTTATSPFYPSWSPFITWDPCPASAVKVYPPTVMKWRPAPLVIRYPSVSVLGHHPVSITAIRIKIRAYITRLPDISIYRVVIPMPIWRKFLVEQVHGHLNVLCIGA